MRALLIALRERPPLKWLVVLVMAACALALAIQPDPAPAPTPARAMPTPKPEPVVDTPPPAKVPGPDVYALLEACLRSARWPGPDLSQVSVAQVRYWVEVEGDPVWFEEPTRAWWLPLSGEGDRQRPSGIYITVPLDGRPCGGAIVN